MDAWQRPTHRATQRVVEATGATCAVAGRGGDCCGALHVHAGLADEAERLARRTIASMPGDAPVLVNSAGCGAAMKDYGHLLDTDDARAFSARVLDVHEWLAGALDELAGRPTRLALGQRSSSRIRATCVTCRRAHLPVRTVLGRYADVVELDDDGLCCGAGGAYSALAAGAGERHPGRKLAAIERADGSVGGDGGRQRQPGLLDAPRRRRGHGHAPARHRRRAHAVSRDEPDGDFDSLADRLDAIAEEIAEAASPS